jgi:hypothetical protein
MTTSTGRKGWVGVDRRWLADPELEDGALRLMLWLESHSDEFLARMNIAKTAEALGTSRNRVKRLVGVLEELGLISTEQLPRQYGGTVTKFTLHLDAWSDGPRQTIDPATGGPDQTGAMVHGEARAVVHGAPPSYEYPQLIEEQLEDSSSAALACLDAVVVDAEIVDDFDRFITAYGNLLGSGKRKARECWDNSLKRGNDPAAIIAGLEAWVPYWRSPGASKAMYAQGFLNQDKWDTPPPPIAVEGGERTAARGMNALRSRASRILAEEAAR